MPSSLGQCGRGWHSAPSNAELVQQRWLTETTLSREMANTTLVCCSRIVVSTANDGGGAGGGAVAVVAAAAAAAAAYCLFVNGDGCQLGVKVVKVVHVAGGGGGGSGSGSRYAVFFYRCCVDRVDGTEMFGTQRPRSQNVREPPPPAPLGYGRTN